MGFLGPVGIKIPLAVDRSVAAMPDVVVGGNEVDVHLTGVVPGRDFPLDTRARPPQRRGGRPLPALRRRRWSVNQGIEIGHVFKLGTKYSKAMGATFLDDKGSEIPLIMGCYGIGVNRIVAAAVEAGHDDNGIIWPLPLAPYHVLIVPLQLQNAGRDGGGRGARDGSSRRPGSTSWSTTATSGPGVKFKDADLIGIPLRVVIGERGLKEGTIEVKWRTDAAAHHVAAATAGEAILAEVETTRKALETTAAPSAGSPGPRRGADEPAGPPRPRLPVRPARPDDGRHLRRPARDRPDASGAAPARTGPPTARSSGATLSASRGDGRRPDDRLPARSAWSDWRRTMAAARRGRRPDDRREDRP